MIAFIANIKLWPTKNNKSTTETVQQKCALGTITWYAAMENHPLSILNHTNIQTSVEHKCFPKCSLSLAQLLYTNMHAPLKSNLHKFCECNVRIVNYKWSPEIPRQNDLKHMCINLISISNFPIFCCKFWRIVSMKWSCNSFRFRIEHRLREQKRQHMRKIANSIRISVVEIWKVYCYIDSVSVYAIKSICYSRLDWICNVKRIRFENRQIRSTIFILLSFSFKTLQFTLLSTMYWIP